jgi:O-methyltransferase
MFYINFFQICLRSGFFCGIIASRTPLEKDTRMKTIKLLVKKLIKNIIKMLLPKNRILTYGLATIGRNRKPYVDNVSGEYIRFSTLELVAQEIYENNIAGAVAELGVYRGDFAQAINESFPDRKLYLFDTFEGFDDRDKKIDLAHKFSEAKRDFSETSVDLVMSKMKYPDNCLVRKGYFPETAEGVDETFAFVSIDVDLYKPIYDGLVHFYQKLSRGGVLCVHDYNNVEYKGVKEAVKRFCRETEAVCFPLSDACGTVAIIKP